MTELLHIVETFTSGTGIWVYLFIFVGKVIEVAFGTLRIVLINRGIRTIGMLVAFVEIMLWLFIASSVLDGFQEDIMKGVAYGVAFAVGNYVGSWLDELLAFGLCSVQVVLPDMLKTKLVTEALHAKGFGITSLDVHGRDNDRYMLLMSMKRKRTGEAIEMIESICPDAVISVADLKEQKGGYMNSPRKARMLHIGRG